MDTQDQPKIKELISGESIAARIHELAAAITSDYQGKDLVAITVCNGGMIFAADLIRAIPLRMTLDTILLASYSGTNSTGSIMLRSELKTVLTGRHVLVLDDILDTGHTLSQLRDILGKQQPASMKFCVLCDKPERRATDFNADYVGFKVPDLFIIGYGMDYNERYRNLPYIGVMS